jgi:adhesin/invasin
VISAILTEPVGTPVSNGTIVQFFTDLGRIDPTGKTKDGVARANFTSDSRSGIAHIVIQSGGPAPVTSASPGTGTATGSGSATVEVTVGNVNVKAVRLRAEPSRITAGASSTTVVATVIDANGNPVANVPVYFSVVADPATEFFDSNGRPQFTNTNGEAFDTLKTRREFTGTAQVKASAAGAGVFVDSPPLAIPIL